MEQFLGSDVISDVVSVIVPVYNVEKYVDQCIQSIVNQTYTNIEIILINDGSTDSSLEKCMLWKKRDGRIRVITKNNEGLGPTRNLGVNEAKGRWIAFIDSDDWIDEKYVEEMLTVAINEDADLVTCGYYRVDENTGKIEKFGRNSSIAVSYTREQQCIYMKTSVCPQLCLRDLLLRNKIEQPNCKAQDFAVKLLMCALAKKCIFIENPLLYYRKNRVGSITTSATTNRIGMAYAAEYLNNEFRNRKLLQQYYYVLLRHELILLAQGLMESWRVESEEKYNFIRREYLNVIKRNFDTYRNLSIIHIGSFNLMHIIRALPYLQDVNKSFQFSSLIGIMNGINNYDEIMHNNIFRKRMVERDIKSLFWDEIKNDNVDYLILDFLEERHDIFYGKNGALTKSDAFDQICFDTSDYKLVKCGSDEWVRLWQKNCINFMTQIQEKIELNHIILVKNKLVEEYGDIFDKRKYEELYYIREKNEVLEMCYEFVEEKYPEVKVVDPIKNDYYFTDKEYEYGVYPWHLNTLVNELIAKEVQNIIETDG